jgi:hypothetical protein
MHFPSSRLHVSCPAKITFNFNALIIFAVYKYWNLALRNFLNPLVPSSLLIPNALLSISFSNTPNLKKRMVFWDQKPCSLVERYQRFGGHSAPVFRHTILWIVDDYLSNYMTSHAWLPLASHSQSRESQTSPLIYNLRSWWNTKFHVFITINIHMFKTDFYITSIITGNLYTSFLSCSFASAKDYSHGYNRSINQSRFIELSLVTSIKLWPRFCGTQFQYIHGLPPLFSSIHAVCSLFSV